MKGYFVVFLNAAHGTQYKKETKGMGKIVHV